MFFSKLPVPPNQAEWRKLPLSQSNHLHGYKPSSKSRSGRVLLASDYPLVWQEKSRLDGWDWKMCENGSAGKKERKQACSVPTGSIFHRL